MSFSKKDLTIRKIANALYLADKHKLDDKVSRKGNEFYYIFDKHFVLTVEFGKYVKQVKSLTVTISDEKHRIVPYTFVKGLGLEDEDVKIIWEKEGPWIKIIEKAIETIYNARRYQIDKEKNKEKEIELHFKNNCKYVKELIHYQRLSVLNTLGKADELDIIKKHVEGMWKEQYTYEIGLLQITLIKGPILPTEGIEIWFKAKDQQYEKVLFKKYFSKKIEEKEFKFENIFWHNFVFHHMHELATRIKEIEEDPGNKATDYFTKKYRLKTF